MNIQFSGPHDSCSLYMCTDVIVTPGGWQEVFSRNGIGPAVMNAAKRADGSACPSGLIHPDGRVVVVN